jgi:competence protein ComEC
MIEGERHSAGRVFAPLMRRLEAEQERWFLWMQVLLGLGIGFYFSLPAEPHILTALAPTSRDARAHGRRTPTHGRDAGADRVDRDSGGVRSRQATRRVGARAGSGQADVVGRGARLRGARRPKAKRGQRVTLRLVSMGDLPPEARPVRARVSTGKMTPGLQAGSAVHLRATLMPPAEPALPGDYDFARQAWFERLGALGYTYTAPSRTRARGRRRGTCAPGPRSSVCGPASRSG